MCHVFLYFCSILQFLSITWFKNSYRLDCILQITNLFIWYILDENVCILYGILFKTNIGPPTSNQTLFSIKCTFVLLCVSLVSTRDHRSLVLGAFFKLFLDYTICPLDNKMLVFLLICKPVKDSTHWI